MYKLVRIQVRELYTGQCYDLDFVPAQGATFFAKLREFFQTNEMRLAKLSFYFKKDGDIDRKMVQYRNDGDGWYFCNFWELHKTTFTTLCSIVALMLGPCLDTHALDNIRAYKITSARVHYTWVGVTSRFEFTADNSATLSAKLQQLRQDTDVAKFSFSHNDGEDDEIVEYSNKGTSWEFVNPSPMAEFDYDALCSMVAVILGL